MVTALLQVRIEDSLKDKAAQVFDNLGIDTSTALRMFLKRAVMENGIPFAMTLPKIPYIADRGYQAMLEMGGKLPKRMDYRIYRWRKSMLRLMPPDKSVGKENNDLLC